MQIADEDLIFEDCTSVDTQVIKFIEWRTFIIVLKIWVW